jgi:DNA polymerase-3 subunit epsilon
MPEFITIDFETADYGPDSACSVGLVKVKDGKITQSLYCLIRPPRKEFVFTPVHGLAWDDVKNEPDFKGVWPKIADFIKEADFLAAHNAPFDKGVLYACCAAAGVLTPPQPFVCTVELARNVLKIRPANLANVCARLGIELDHHNALSDAEACAGIVLAAGKSGGSSSNYEV